MTGAGEPCCCVCGLDHGEFDETCGVTVSLALCEALDDRFRMSDGVQWFCSSCLWGRVALKRRRSVSGAWFFGVRTPRTSLCAISEPPEDTVAGPPTPGSIPEKPNAIWLLTQIGRASRSDQRVVLARLASRLRDG